jgi:hypothetical protein
MDEEDEDTMLIKQDSKPCQGVERTVYQRVPKHNKVEEYYCGLCERFMPISHFPH